MFDYFIHSLHTVINTQREFHTLQIKPIILSQPSATLEAQSCAQPVGFRSLCIFCFPGNNFDSTDWYHLLTSSYFSHSHSIRLLPDHRPFNSTNIDRCWTSVNSLHGYTVHQIMLNTFYYQLTHTTLKNAELLKHSKINKNAPTCFGLHGNHLQGAKVSTWLKVTLLVKSRCVKDVQVFVSAMAAYCDL